MFESFQFNAICLETPRLWLRTPKVQDALLLADYYYVNEQHLRPWEPSRDRDFYSEPGWRFRIKVMNKQQADGELFSFVLMNKESNELIGIVNFTQVMYGNAYSCQLGYSIAEKYQGQGLMFEALQSTIAYLFNKRHMHRISAGYIQHNHRSGNLLKRLGFHQEGYAIQYLMINHQWQDHVLMALLNKKWEPQKN